MGWKVFSLFFYEPDAKPLSENSVHNSKKAKKFLNKLHRGNFELIELSDYEQGLYPDEAYLYVGAYNGVYIVSQIELVSKCFDSPVSLGNIARKFSEYNILAAVLISTNDFYGYAYCEDGKLVRMKMGCPDDGTIIDHGRPLIEEQELLKKFVIKDGRRIWIEKFGSETDEYTENEMGEEFVFELTKRIFGKRLDEVDHLDLKMDKFRRTKLTFFQKLIGR